MLLSVLMGSLILLVVVMFVECCHFKDFTFGVTGCFTVGL